MRVDEDGVVVGGLVLALRDARVARLRQQVQVARYTQRCGVSVSLRALRILGSGIAKLVTHTDPREHVVAIARYARSREPSNVVGVHLYSFGGAERTASWIRALI